MQFVFLCAACIAGPAIVGAVISLIALLPPVRHIGQNSANSHYIKAGLLAFVTFWAVFGGYSGLIAEVLVDEMADPPCQCSEDPNYVKSVDVMRNKNTLRLELGIQMMFPPPFRPICITTHGESCEIAAKITRQWDDFGPVGSTVYFATLFAAFFAATITYVVVLGLDHTTGLLSTLQVEIASTKSTPP